MTKKLLIITQSVDEHGGVLEFFIGWITELAKHCERIEVIALGIGTYHVPANVHVHSLGKEKGVSKIRQFWRMGWLLLRLTPTVDGVFAHMSPIFAIAAWPFTFLFRKRLLLWYLHRSLTWKLKIATMLSHAVVTADIDSLRLKSKKIVAIGHGINAKRFAAARTGQLHNPVQVAIVGRITPIKHVEVLIEAAHLLHSMGRAIQVTVVGAPMLASDIGYADQLKLLVTARHLGDIVHFTGYVPHQDLPQLYARMDMVVGLTPPGGIDKVLIEAMASGCLILTSNTVITKYVGDYADLLICPHGEAKELADHIETLMRLSDAQRKDMSGFLAQAAAQYHNVEHVAVRIMELI